MSKAQGKFYFSVHHPFNNLNLIELLAIIIKNSDCIFSFGTKFLGLMEHWWNPLFKFLSIYIPASKSNKTADAGRQWPWLSAKVITSILLCLLSLWLPANFTIYRSQTVLAILPSANFR